MADALVLEASGANRGGSSPPPRITLYIMKYLIAWLPARIMYWIGHMISLTLGLEFIDLYPVYNWFMIYSSVIDEWGETDLWQLPKNEE